jgi:acetaldehyde dehydrogenase (acetylating)
MLRQAVVRNGKLNIDQVGRSPEAIAEMAGFRVPRGTRALVSPADVVGAEEPLSRETLSPILTLYTVDGWESGCDRCMEVLTYGGMGHTLGIHATNERIIEAFAVQKPAMRIVVNSVTALGSVGFTNRLFPSMTLGPGTIGGSITSDNISPLHLLNIKRVAFETDPINPPSSRGSARRGQSRGASVREAPSVVADSPKGGTSKWMAEIESRLRDRAGSRPDPDRATAGTGSAGAGSAGTPVVQSAVGSPPSPPETGGLSDEEIDALISQYRRA